MGEYIKHPKTEKVIKIGSMDYLFYTREQLLEFKDDGYIGFYTGEYDESFEKTLLDPHTIYSFGEKYEGIKDVDFILPIPEEFVPGSSKTPSNPYEYTLPTHQTFEHHHVILHHSGYQYKEQCLEKGKNVIRAQAIGLQYINGQFCTVFRCRCCEFLHFGIDHITAMFLRVAYPDLKEVLYSYGDKIAEDNFARNGEIYEELSLYEALESLASRLSYAEFIRMLGKEWEKVYKLSEEAIKNKDYPTLWNFYYNHGRDENHFQKSFENELPGKVIPLKVINK